MSDFLRCLINYRTLRAATKQLPIEQIRTLFERLQVILQEREDEEKATRIQEEKKQENINLVLELMEADGIDPHDLLCDEPDKKSVPKNKRQPRPAKYVYKNELGEVKTWTGQGRCPSVIKKALEVEGNNLEDFEINDSNRHLVKTSIDSAEEEFQRIIGC